MLSLKQLLIEKIILSNEIFSKIERAVDKWFNIVSNGQLSVQYDRRDRIKEEKGKLEILRKTLHPTINKVLKDNLNFIKDQHYLGHKLRLVINTNTFADDVSVSGWFSKKPFKLSKSPHSLDYFLVCELYLEVPQKVNKNTTRDELISVISHELTHLIQLARTKNKDHQITAKPSNLKNSDNDTNYLALRYEIDAFAQSVASDIILHAKQFDDPYQTVQNQLTAVKHGLDSLFGKKIIPSDSYHTYKKKFSNIKDDRNRTAVWKIFNKKLYEKLVNWLEHN